MGAYSKFKDKTKYKDKKDNTDKYDHLAYYQKPDGTWQRLGANEFNNVDHFLTENDLMNERIKLDIPFASLKTEQETMAGVHLPE